MTILKQIQETRTSWIVANRFAPKRVCLNPHTLILIMKNIPSYSGLTFPTEDDILHKEEPLNLCLYGMLVIRSFDIEKDKFIIS